MTESARWVRVLSCWACNLTHRRDGSVMEGEREETESVCCRCPAEPLAVGLLTATPHTPHRAELDTLCLALKLFLFLFCFFQLLHVTVVTGSQSAFFNALLSFWSFCWLLARLSDTSLDYLLTTLSLVTFNTPPPTPPHPLSVLFSYFTTLFSVFHLLDYSCVGLSLAYMLKNMMLGLVFLLPTQTECSISLFCRVWFLSLRKRFFFFPPTKAWTHKNMLILCPLKGFMHLFSSLLFKAFSLTLMFSVYHAAMWLHVARGESVYACVCLVLPFTYTMLSFHQNI